MNGPVKAPNGIANQKRIFDPKIFLSKVGKGRSIAEYAKKEVVFAQGDAAEAIFYIQKGKVKLTVVSNAGKEAVIAKISQETLAEMIGTTRSRVSFFMNKFRKMGFIEYNGKLHVHSSLLNIVLHD